MKIKSNSTLILGSGAAKYPHSINVDINSIHHPDVIHDLNKFPYPFKTNQFKKIIACNIIEHLDDVIKVMEELYRITKPNGIIDIVTGHFSSVDSFNDPTHKHFFTSRSFDYLIPQTDLYKYKYTKIKFKKIKVILGPQNHHNIFVKLILFLINKNIIFYESRLAFIFPIGVIYYKLQVIK
jgi:SAM-dependent methyltransferase